MAQIAKAAELDKLRNHINKLEAGERAADAAITKYQRDLEIQKAANEDFSKRINRMINLIEMHEVNYD